MSIYGAGVDNTIQRWAYQENEHDRMHPDRNQCAATFGCPMMAAAVDLMHQLEELLNRWRDTNRAAIADADRSGGTIERPRGGE